MFYLLNSNMQIINSAFENISCDYFISSVESFTDNVFFTLRNIYCNNLTSFDTVNSMITFSNINVIIANLNLGNSFSYSYDGFINCVAEINTNYTITLENIYWNNNLVGLNTQTAHISFYLVNVIIVNLSFENIFINDNYNFISGQGDFDTNYTIIIANINFNNLTSSNYAEMISCYDVNLIIANSSLENSYLSYTLFYSVADSLTNFTITLANNYFNNLTTSSNKFLMSSYQVNSIIVNSIFENSLIYGLFSSTSSSEYYNFTLANSYFHNLTYTSSSYMIDLFDVNLIIVNTSFENFFIYCLIHIQSDSLPNYTITLENIYLNNLTCSYMIYFIDLNSIIVNLTLENSMTYYDFVYCISDTVIPNNATYENVYWNNCTASSGYLIYFNQFNAMLVNSTFENNSCICFLYSLSNGPYSLTLQHIRITINTFSDSGIYIVGGITNLMVDSLEFNQNIFGLGSVFLISSLSSSNIVFLNSLGFHNNLGKTFI